MILGYVGLNYVVVVENMELSQSHQYYSRALMEEDYCKVVRIMEIQVHQDSTVRVGNGG